MVGANAKQTPIHLSSIYTMEEKNKGLLIYSEKDLTVDKKDNWKKQLVVQVNLALERIRPPESPQLLPNDCTLVTDLWHIYRI